MLLFGADRPTRDAAARGANGGEIVTAKSVADLIARLRRSKRFRVLVVGPRIRDAHGVVERVRDLLRDIPVVVVAEPDRLSELRRRLSQTPGLNGVTVVSTTRPDTLAGVLSRSARDPDSRPDGRENLRTAITKEQSAREASERSRMQLIFLAEASAALSASLDFETILQTVARLAVPTLADWCQIDLVDNAGAIHRIAVAHADPAQERLVRELAERYPTPPEARHGAPSVIRTGASEIASEIPAGAMERTANDRAHLKLLQRLRLTSTMFVPLIARGRTLGAISFMAGASGRRFGPDDLTFAEQLASRAALAVDNARLFALERLTRQQAEATQQRLGFLARAGELLTSSLDYEATLSRLADLIVPELADWCVIDVREGEEIRRVAVAHADPAKRAWARELEKRYPPRLDSPRGAGAVIRTGQPETFGEPGDDAMGTYGIDPEFAEILRGLGITSGMIVPLIARGRIIGALTLVSVERRRDFGEDDLAFAQDLARHAALAVDNARLLRDAQKAEQSLTALVNGLDAIVWEADVETGRITFINQRVAELTGHPIEHWTGRPHSWWNLVHPLDRDRIRAARQDAIESDRSHDAEYRIAVASGPERWVRDAAQVIGDASGGPALLRGVIVETTARKVAEARQQAQHAVTRVLSDAATLAEAAPRMLQAMCEALGWELGAIWQIDETGGLIRCLEVWCRPEVLASEFIRVTRESALPAGVGLPGRVWSTGAPAWIPDVVVDENFPRAPTAAIEGLHGAFGFPVVLRGRPLGVMEFFSHEIREPDDDLLRMMAAIGAQVGQFIDRKRAEEALAQSEARLRFQNALLESESEATLDGILVVSPDGTLLLSNRRFAEMWSIPEEVIATGSDPALIDFVLEQLRDPDEFRARIGYLYDHPGEFSRDEIALVDGRIIDRWSTPLEASDGTRYGRAWYFRDVTEQKRAERRLRDNEERFAFLAEASSVLSGSLDHERSFEALARLVVPYLADWCVIDVIEPDGGVRRVAIAHVDADKAALARRLELNRQYLIDPDAEHGLPKVLRTGRAEFAPKIPEGWLEAVSETPEYLETLREMGFHAYICVPLLARGRILGAITLVTAESGRTYSDDELAFAEELARRAALAIDNARLYRDRADVARTLQESLLPPRLPEIPGVEVAARYLAAVERNEVGGDFYDLFKTRKNSWAVVIGDVCGKGAEAATITALARYTVRTIAMQMRKPARILESLNEALLSQRSDARFCTVAYGRLDVGGPNVRIDVACGGHPLPLIVRADGTVEPGGRPGTLLGMFPDPELHEISVELRSGDAIVFYTDGVTEARGEEEHFGDERLEALLRSCAGQDAGHIAELLERTALDFQQSRPRDDIALLVLRVP
jgi:PAS domain S-box-containing protein